MKLVMYSTFMVSLMPSPSATLSFTHPIFVIEREMEVCYSGMYETHLQAAKIRVAEEGQIIKRRHSSIRDKGVYVTFRLLGFIMLKTYWVD